MKVCVLIFTLLLCLKSHALSCLEPKLEYFVKNPFIVKAKILEVVEEGKRGEYKVEIIQNIKGNAPLSKATLKVFTWMGSPKFNVGKEYIFFSKKPDEINTGACGMYFKGDDSKALKKIKELLKK